VLYFRAFCILCSVLFGFSHIGCGSSSPPPNSDLTMDPSVDSNHFIDWDALDWKFIHRLFPMDYSQFRRTKSVPISYGVYKKETRFEAPVEALTLSQFQSLPLTTQLKRRQESEKYLVEAMAFHRAIDQGWELWTNTLLRQTGEGAFLFENGMVTPTIKNLETATGLDPANPFTWRHLAFFTGLVGDRYRQIHALDCGFEALADYENRSQDFSINTLKELATMRLRMLLDRSWLLRELGRFNESRNDVELALILIGNDNLKTLDLGREALLLQALIMVDQGLVHEARVKAKKLETWSVPFMGNIGQTTPMVKDNFQHYESDFCRHWVWAMTHMKLGNAAQVTDKISDRELFTSFPPHLGYRFWQEMGRIQEHFGEFEKATNYYALGTLNRPFLPYFPVEGAAGFVGIFGQKDTAETQYLGFNEFFLGGSYFSFAANFVADMDEASTPRELVHFGTKALDALTICQKQGIRPASTLALRGNAHYLLGNLEKAEQDLNGAQLLFAEANQESSPVIRLLGLLHFLREDYAGSLLLLDRYNELEPEDAFGHRLQGLNYAHMNRFSEAKSCLNNALEIEPRSLAGLYNRALILLHLGQVESAQTDLQQAHLLEPDNEEINRLMALIKSDPGKTFTISTEMVDLNTALNDSTRVTRTRAPAQTNLASNLSKEDRDRLLNNLRNSYEMSPTREQRLTLAHTLLQAGQTKEVQDLLMPFWPSEITLEETILLLKADRSLGQPNQAAELALSLKTEPEPVPDSEFWALVAIICLENGVADPGLLALDQALELDPHNTGLRMIKSNQSN
jgi:tetratricopeptide (TPR) repeat protein